MMNYFVLGIFIFLLLESFVYTQEVEVVVENKDNQCDAYCFKVLRPMLEHISVMQERWEFCNSSKLANTSSRLDKIESQLVAQEAKDVSYAAAIEETKMKLLEQKSLIENQKNINRKPFQKVGSKYYYIEEIQQLNWFGAAHKCLEFGAHLISLDDQQELNAINSKLNPVNAYWTDINDLSEEGTFLSLTSGVRAKFLNWRTGEPNNADRSEHCVYLFGAYSHMNDFKCSSPKYFICESFDA
ncbi:accessory gland protein Acp29AB-like [Drosophila innubila]|uniref:accessory gland protein Acp29AB-like n=1 Tax=Drosophila innubila TaxID=198719 RepID=UPI00148CFDD4|nr:accessory gland protein Acp29AB-like [Drosophila innubila]